MFDGHCWRIATVRHAGCCCRPFCFHFFRTSSDILQQALQTDTSASIHQGYIWRCTLVTSAQDDYDVTEGWLEIDKQYSLDIGDFWPKSLYAIIRRNFAVFLGFSLYSVTKKVKSKTSLFCLFRRRPLRPNRTIAEPWDEGDGFE